MMNNTTEFHVAGPPNLNKFYTLDYTCLAHVWTKRKHEVLSLAITPPAPSPGAKQVRRDFLCFVPITKWRIDDSGSISWQRSMSGPTCWCEADSWVWAISSASSTGS